MEERSLHITEITSDIKAEVIAADMVEDGRDVDDIVISPAGTFERTYSRDILSLEERQDKLGLKNLVFMDVSREGLYNALPEALFHFYDREKRAGSNSFVEEYKKHKVEEEAARSFFLAFEKEMNRLRTLTELEERKSILGFSEQFKADLFLRLWPELSDIAPEYLPAMILLLPVSHKVTGNTDLAATLLSYVVDRKVAVTCNYSTRAVANPTGSNILASRSLGYDTIIGDWVPDNSPLVEVSIGPVKKGELLKFMLGGEAYKAIDLACKHLFAVLADINISVLLDNFDEKLILSDEISDGKLGFTSRL
ncbi:MAG TPA: type VI secretion system baseplate subunit TssG [Chitinophagales bacterium]|nr:type VI secretion system baseplate subunit TssG [Chitinophagales bacterium]